MGSVLTLAQAEIAYDPNLADTGDVDMEGSDGDYYDDDDGGEYDDDEYNDDEDTSWKVRRAACLLLVALVAAYPEQAASLYSQCRPTLQVCTCSLQYCIGSKYWMSVSGVSGVCSAIVYLL